MFKKFVSYYKPHWKLFTADIIAATLMGAIDLIFPIVSRKTLNEYLNTDNIHMLYIIAGVMIGFFVLRFFFSYFIGYYGHIMGIRIETDMRRDLFHKLQLMDYQFYDKKKTGVLVTNLTTHLHDISEMSHHAPENIFISILMLIGSFILLGLINWRLTLIIYVFMLLLVLFSLYRRKKMIQRFKEIRVVQGELAARVESSISGIRLTQAYSNREYEEARFEKSNNEYKKARIRVFKELALFGTGNNFLINMANLAALVFGGLFVYKGYITIVDLTAFFLYINFLIQPINRLVNSMEQIQQGMSGFAQFYEVMQKEPEIVNPENGVVKQDFEGKIEFNNVVFDYEEEDDDKKHLLNNFNLTIEPGKKIAIVGETGVGKSTLSKLIPRFYDVQAGEILVDGINVKDYDIKFLRSAIGHVQQDVFIFYGTIKENILFGRPDASFEEIIDAAKKAQIHDFIVSLDDGYDTIVGERGVRLSGGQQQRISIARLFLKNPKILLLDEATSSLDNITEKQIQKALDLLALNKTTIIIAHRLSTIKNADEIIVLGKDGIMERGNHDELLENKGYYFDLYEASVMI
ncbi:MAG TPA: ABC transporter ATP-binding protein [Acholeplasma sp.]|jgi:ATP-binding cassette subfamily B protein|nr:ABC transporter ATP-binding protein [Acholeplasma sp.]